GADVGSSDLRRAPRPGGDGARRPRRPSPEAPVSPFRHRDAGDRGRRGAPPGSSTGRPARGDDRGVVRAAERSDPPQRHDPPGEQVTGRFSAPTVPPPSANPCPEPLSRSGSGVGAGPAPGLCPPPGAGVEPTERRGSRKARSARGAVLPAVPAAGRPGAGRL